MDHTKFWHGHAVGYEDAAHGRHVAVDLFKTNPLWRIGYMSGYLTAAGIKVGPPPVDLAVKPRA